MSYIYFLDFHHSQLPKKYRYYKCLNADRRGQVFTVKTIKIETTLFILQNIGIINE